MPQADKQKILVLGGYTTQGKQLLKCLPHIVGLEILVCGRYRGILDPLCEELNHHSGTHHKPLVQGRSKIREALAKYKPLIVIDASGDPSEAKDPQGVPKACIECQVHYMDFALSSTFISSLQSLNESAKEASVAIMSGVNTLPIILSQFLQTHKKSESFVANGVEIGFNTAFESEMFKSTQSAEKPINITTIAPPGQHALSTNKRFSSKSIDEQQLLMIENVVSQYNERQNSSSQNETRIHTRVGCLHLHPYIAFWAKSVSAIKDLIGNTFSLPTDKKIMLYFDRCCDYLARLARSPAGAVIEINGIRDNKTVTATWHMLGQDKHFHDINVALMGAIIRRWMTVGVQPLGVTSATDAFDLTEIESMLSDAGFPCGLRSSDERSGTIFQQLLGKKFDSLPERIRKLHGMGKGNFSGKVNMTCSGNILGKFLSSLLGLPTKSNHNGVLKVAISPVAVGDEKWEHLIDSKKFQSVQRAGLGVNEYMLEHRLGRLCVLFSLIIDNNRLLWTSKRVTVFGLTMPIMRLMAEVDEQDQNDLYQFRASIKSKLLGELVTLRGSLDI